MFTSRENVVVISYMLVMSFLKKLDVLPFDCMRDVIELFIVESSNKNLYILENISLIISMLIVAIIFHVINELFVYFKLKEGLINARDSFTDRQAMWIRLIFIFFGMGLILIGVVVFGSIMNIHKIIYKRWFSFLSFSYLVFSVVGAFFWVMRSWPIWLSKKM